jgi:D-amino peptidase
MITLRTTRRFAVVGLGLVALGRALGGQAPSPPSGWEWRAVAPVASPLRILVQYDMEGLSGVDRLSMVKCHTSAYAAGVDRLVADVNAVIEGLSQARVASIDVIDRHGSGCDTTPDLPKERLDPRARYVNEGAAPVYTRITRKEWDAVILVGGHSSPGRGGFLEHVGSFGFERIVNGVSTSESEQSGLVLGQWGIPVIFASGDDRYRQQLAERMPWVTFTQVKRATSRASAELRPADVARSELIANARAAVARRNEARLLAVVPPFTGAYKPVWPQTLDELGAVPGVDTTGGMIRVAGANLGEVNANINRVGLMVSNASVARTFWDAAERDPRLDRWRDSVFMAKWAEGRQAPKPNP